MAETTPPTTTRKVRAPQQQRSYERERALIRAGLHLVEIRDWDDVKVSDIAAEIGCSTGTFYTRFHNKDAYFDVLLNRLVQAMVRHAETFHADPQRQSESTAEFVGHWVRMNVQSFRQHRGLYTTAMLKLRRLEPAARAASPLVRLREASRTQLLQTMARDTNWRSPSAQQRLVFAHQMMQGVLINTVLTDPGPLFLNDDAFEAELSAMVHAYLDLAPAPKTTTSRSSTTAATRTRQQHPSPPTKQETP